MHGLGYVGVLASMRRAHRNEAAEESLGKPPSNFPWNLWGVSKSSQASEEHDGFLSDSPRFSTYDLYITSASGAETHPSKRLYIGATFPKVPLV